MNINRVGVEVDRGSKVYKRRDVQGYPRAPETVHFHKTNPPLERWKSILKTVNTARRM